MAEISKITTPNGSSYDLKDAAARSGLAGKIDKVTTATAGNIPEFDSSGGLIDSGWSYTDFRSKDIDSCVLAGTITGNEGVTILSNFSEAWWKVTNDGSPVFLVLQDLSYSGPGQSLVLSTICAAHFPDEDNDSKIISFSVPRNNGVCYVDWVAVGGDESNAVVDTAFESDMTIVNVNASLDPSTMSISDADCTLAYAWGRLSRGATVCLTLDGYRGWATGAYGVESLSDSWIEFTVLIYANLGGGDHPYMLTVHWGNDGEDDTWEVTTNELAQTSELFSGDYNDLSNTPTIPTVGTLNTTVSTAQSTNASESLSGSVTLHKVSKTGSYNDLLNKPTIPAAQVQTDWNATTGMGVILNKPSNLQTTSNLVTSLSSSSTDSQYPSAKCVHDGLAGKADSSHTHSSIVNGDCSLSLSQAGVATITAPSQSVSESSTMSEVAVALGLSESSTLDDLRQECGLSETDTLQDVIAYVNSQSGQTTTKTVATTDQIPSVSAATLSSPGIVRPDGTTITVSNGVITAVGGGGGGGSQELRYAIVTPTTTTSTTDSSNDTLSATLQDRAVNIVAAGSGIDYVNLTFPAQTQGYARDFFVRLVLTGTDVPAVEFSEPGGGDVDFDVDDDSWADIDLGVNLIMFTETSQGPGSNS